MRNEHIKTLEKFSVFNAQLSQEEMSGAQGGQGYTLIKFSTEISANGTWVTEDYYIDGKYSYSSTTPDGCKM